MADYSWAYEKYEDDKIKEIRAAERLRELRAGYTNYRITTATSVAQCIRCGCLVGNKQLHNTKCEWTEEMLQHGLEKLGEL